MPIAIIVILSILGVALVPVVLMLTIMCWWMFFGVLKMIFPKKEKKKEKPVDTELFDMARGIRDMRASKMGDLTSALDLLGDIVNRMEDSARRKEE